MFEDVRDDEGGRKEDSWFSGLDHCVWMVGWMEVLITGTENMDKMSHPGQTSMQCSIIGL